MRKLATLAVLLTFAIPAAGQQPSVKAADSTSAVLGINAAKAQAEGEILSSTVSTSGWFAGGFFSGLFLGLIGTGVTYAFAAASKVELPPAARLQIASEPPAYQHVYESAFARKVKSRRGSSALTGGLIGTAALLLIVVSASGSGQ